MILDAEEIIDRGLCSLRPEQRAGGRIGQLRRDPHFTTRPHQCAADDDIDVRLDADLFGSAESLANREAAMLERTTSDFKPPSDVVTASGRLNARKSVSTSGRSS